MTATSQPSTTDATHSTHTPMMRQFLKIKSQHPELLLLSHRRFYELFFDDAIQAADLLHITLTTEEKARANQSPWPASLFMPLRTT